MIDLSPSVKCMLESLNLEIFLEFGGLTSVLDVDELLVSSKVFSPSWDGTTPEELLSEEGKSGALCGLDLRLSREEEASKRFSSSRNSSA